MSYRDAQLVATSGGEPVTTGDIVAEAVKQAGGGGGGGGDLAALTARVEALETQIATLTQALANKVDAVEGKGLSTVDFTEALSTKLDGIATGATANATDTHLLDRANHTGEQAISTVTGLQSALDAKEDKTTP